MNEEKILYLKEDIHTELKEAQGGVPRNVWETISAFANTSGGSIYFGVKEGKEKNEILGVENPEDMIRDLLTTERAGKLSYPIFREEDFSLLVLQGRKILVLHIPEANRMGQTGLSRWAAGKEFSPRRRRRSASQWRRIEILSFR